MKYLGHSWAYINFHKKSKNIKFSSRISLKRKRAPSGATRRAGKPVLWPKTQKWQNFLQIYWNLVWRSPIRCHVQPKKLRPRFEVDQAFFDVSVPSLASLLGSSSSLCKHVCRPNSGFSCAWACLFPYYPSPTTSQYECWLSQVKSAAQKVSCHPVSSGPIPGLHGFSATLWVSPDPPIVYSATPNNL